MGRPSFREQLLSSGVGTVHRRGFATVGVRELTAAAGIAQGSFTNHFVSKEEFGAAVVDRYSEMIQVVLEETLRDESLPPLLRLRAYFERIVRELARCEWRYGCLAGNMGLEAAEHSELIRERVTAYLDAVEDAFAQMLMEAQKSGALHADLNCRETAAALHEAWQGALLRMKVERSPEPVHRFLRLTFPAVLRLPSTVSAKPARTTRTSAAPSVKGEK